MEIIELKHAHSDFRGCIIDLISDEDINSVTLITFTKGSVRANHFHKRTIQWNYVLAGEILLVTQFPDSDRKEHILRKGDFAVTYANEYHALQGITDAEVLILTRGPRSGVQYECDTFRLEIPLICSEA